MQLLRPTRFKDVVGQSRAKLCLKTMIESAKQRDSVLPHILFSASAGTGKTTLATVIANECGVKIRFLNGGNVKNIKDILPTLLQLKTGDILFIDEIHRLPEKVQETMYTAMEDFHVDIKVKIDVAEFTMVGATTDTGLLLKPFYDRFVMKVHLDEYTLANISSIIQNNAAKLSLESLRTTIVTDIARRSRLNPRVANSNTIWIRDYIIANGLSASSFSEADLNNAMSIVSIDKLGLTRDDRLYLKFLKSKSKKPIGLKTIAASTNLSEETIEYNIEPWLLQLGLIEKTSRGRIIV